MNRAIRRTSYLRPGRLMPRAARGLRAGSVVLAPGETMPCHSTGAREELLIAVAGRLLVEARSSARATRRIAMQRGQALFLPRRTPHAVFNRSKARAMYLYITGRSLDSHHGLRPRVRSGFRPTGGAEGTTGSARGAP